MAVAVASARRTAGLTLAALAAETGLSPAYLSQIESGSANPTVRTLGQVAAAVGVTLAELFGARRTPEARFAPHFSPAALAVSARDRTGVWDRTAPGSTRLRARLVHGGAGDHANPVTHPGEEFVVVLRGSCCLHVDGTARTLGPGDACHYDATHAHRLTDVTTDLTLSVVMSETAVQ